MGGGGGWGVGGGGGGVGGGGGEKVQGEVLTSHTCCVLHGNAYLLFVVESFGQAG